MQDAQTPTLTPHQTLDEARRRLAEARAAIHTVAETSRRVFPGLDAMLSAVASLLGAVRLGLGRPEVADAALEHVMSAGQAHMAAARRGRWARREFAEDLRPCLTELVVAGDLIAALLQERQPHASPETHEALERAPFMLAVAGRALAIRRPGTSTDDILKGVSLNLRLLVDTGDVLRRGIEAALIPWQPDG